MEKEKKSFHSKDDETEVTEANKEFFERLGVIFVVPMYANGRIAGFITLARPVNTNEIYIYEDYDVPLFIQLWMLRRSRRLS